MSAQAGRTINELVQLVVTNGASDGDVPANFLSYQLLNAPAGAVIGSGGVIRWTPTEGQGPGVYTLTTVVTDDGVPALSATNSFTVTVNEVNSAPVLPVQKQRTINELAQLVVATGATDADLPATRYLPIGQSAGGGLD